MGRIKLAIISLIVILVLLLTGTLGIYISAWYNVTGITVPVDKNPTTLFTDPLTGWFNENLDITYGWVLSYFLLILLFTIGFTLVVGGFVTSALTTSIATLLGFDQIIVEVLTVAMFIPGAIISWRMNHHSEKADQIRKIMIWLLISLILFIVTMWVLAATNTKLF
jgi:heme/copper-type cytochrome/quinol oxidase subunit 4